MSQWQNRITRYSIETPDQLLANPFNHKVHTTIQQESLSEILRTVGVVQNVIVNERTGRVVDGHARILLALRENQNEIPVTWIDVSEEEEVQIILFFDEIGRYASKDSGLLRSALDMVGAISFDSPGMKQMFDDLERSAKKLMTMPPTDDLFAPSSPLFAKPTSVHLQASDTDTDVPYDAPEPAILSGRGNVMRVTEERETQRFALSIVLDKPGLARWQIVKDQLNKKSDTDALIALVSWYEENA